MVVPNIHEQCWEPTTSLNDIRKCIQNGHHIMVILRGIPGSGKSCLASDLVSGTNGAVFSSDKYFMQSGVYKFDPTKLDEYHHKNWIEAKKAIQHGIKPIIIDNTNIFVAHMKPYITLAVKNLYEIYFVEPETEWKKNVKECTRRSAHFVPEEKIAYMAECFEKINLTDIIKPTQLRIIPPLIDMDDSDNTYSLLLPKLDSSLSEYPENVRKANAEKEEIERAELLPSDISQCSLYDAVNLLKISSTDLEKDVIDKKKTSEQLFSLIPPQISKKSLRTVGCQTSDLIRIFDLSDSLPSVSDEFLWGTIQNDIDLNNKKKMKGKMVQAGDGNILLDIELLLALFPNEKPSDLSHILEIVGLNNAVTLLKEMNGNMNVCTPVDKNKNIEAEPLSKTYYWWDETEFERISNNSSPLFVPNLGMKTAIPEKLAPCTYMQCSDPEPVPEGYYRMEISVDMMQQLTQLFGNSENSNFLKTYVDLPIWLWRQIYLCWQGESTTKVNNGFEDFDFSIFTNPDEELARILQNHELAFDESLENGKHMNIAERLQLSALINHYSEVDRERVIECFRDNKFSAEATRNTLELFVNGTENIQRALVDPSGIASSINQPGSCQFASNGLSVPKPDLKSVHEDACELRKEADRYNKQKEEMLTRAKNQRELGAKMFYFSEAQKFGKKAKDCVAELNERLTKANTWDLFIDLHYMDVQSAIKLLKSKLNAADRPVDLRRGRSGKKLVVLTGYGKLNNGQAKIRPAVIQWLEQCGYEGMFPADKPLPPPPLPEKPSWKSKDNATEASAPATAIRLQSPTATAMHSLPSTSYSPTVADYVYRRVLRQAIAAICKQAGFEAIEADVLELLTHMINSYINELAVTTRQMTEHAGRTISTPSDTVMALVDLGTAVSDLPAFLKETTSKGSLVIAPPRTQHVPQTQQQLRVGSSRPRPSHIPDWLPPFPDPHTYVRTDISGEPEPSYEKAREGVALLYRNTVMSLKDFVLRTHPSISLFDLHKQRILKKIAAAAAERTRQQQTRMMAYMEEDEQKTMTNGAATEVHNAEQSKTIDPEFPTTISEKFFFEEDDEKEISLLQAEVPTFGEIIEPKTSNEPYLDSLLSDLQNEPAFGIKTKLSEDTGSDGNPFLRSPKMPSILDDDLMHEYCEGRKGTFGDGKFNAAFGTAKTVFGAVKKPEIQRKLIAASKNETVRSAVSFLAKNEGARKAALNALQDEKTLKTAYHIAQACDRQQQQKNLANLNSITAGTFVRHDATSKFDAKKAPASIYPSLPPLQDNVYNNDRKATDNLTITPNQLVSQNFSKPIFASETNTFTGMKQEERPHGHAKFRFLASCFDELSAEPFDMIILEKKVDEQWVYALNKRTGQKGIIPLLYIDVKIPLPTVLSTPQMPFYAVALFDFDSSVSGDLSFRANDEIYVIERINNDWLRGTIGIRQGIFPANYIREITGPTTMTSESTSFHASAEYVNALYDYNSAIEDDLIFRAGDRIEVLEWVSKDWLRGKLNGKIGLVPRTYIENYSSNDNAGKELNVTNTIVTATKDYYNVSKDHLCFSKGDKIEVIEEISDNWLKGKLLLNMSNTKSFPVGLFPRSAIL